MARTRREQVARSRELRRGQTEVEALLWRYLRRRQLNGFRFRRQHPIGPYIADFACLEPKLVIELDGSQHIEDAARDRRRDRFLRQQGYRVLRFTNDKVSADVDTVLEVILEALES